MWKNTMDDRCDSRRDGQASTIMKKNYGLFAEIAPDRSVFLKYGLRIRPVLVISTG
ncbi:MAG: hypothetical protein ABI045_05595 [Flavobacteriales bacterium]